MLNFNTPVMNTKEYSEIKISEVEPIFKVKLNKSSAVVHP